MFINKRFIYNFSYKWGRRWVFFPNRERRSGDGDGKFFPGE